MDVFTSWEESFHHVYMYQILHFKYLKILFISYTSKEPKGWGKDTLSQGVPL